MQKITTSWVPHIPYSVHADHQKSPKKTICPVNDTLMMTTKITNYGLGIIEIPLRGKHSKDCIQ